ncbi:Predicted flavoprotein CzcO associated with the cation diffusion facilitator CzcD [Amycolatopsis arida]|uniref:Predicted flavoprotein CzcO associated with the cation diffusion facilitator CzcD n=1 Tax=Amycolatopsis arida TaxID=587909 RepID=A0A1I5V5D7_9PSEU|nr:NAD(P)/FAD-dependent oxidoreductase [Amycolatopsis arida]TDX91154.1 cation diffusion facilitator CzcD-associated flavoprotein CzcO [Amycolatopsis arida]SFQ02661.1 Predicted flavoprotein CzcO associated with the cation diffusion facilitator CzcD [Amycolatopsis arida]
MTTEEHHRVVIVGAGLGGIGAAVRLFRKGVSDLVILEAAGSPGGTWRVNSYPGCQCDIPSNLYSLSFAPNAAWSTTFPLQPEIQDYVLDVTARFDLDKVIRYHTELRRARWDATAARWRLTTSAGRLSADVLVLALGFLSQPFVPPIDGLDRFRGAAFHSAEWNHGVDLTGRRVAVVGTGASAVQLIPEIADRVGHLDVYQRTPAWVLPHPNRRVTGAERWLYRHLPVSQTARRALTFVGSEARHAVLTKPGALNRVARALGRWNIRRAIRDPDLADRVTPRYELGCKRVLLSNRYYPALARPDVDVINDHVVATTAGGVVSGSGEERPADVVVFATGFQVTGRADFARIHGAGGQDLAADFAEHGAYLGVTASGFPNLFCIGGPTSGVGHTSFLFMLESQQAYVADAVAAMAARSWAAVDVRREVQDGYFAEIQRASTDKVWLTGCTSWFLDGKGRNVAVWPGYSWTFHRRTRRFDPGAYHVVPAR